MSVYIKIEQQDFDEKDYKDLKVFFLEEYEQADSSLPGGMSLRRRRSHDTRILAYPRIHKIYKMLEKDKLFKEAFLVLKKLKQYMLAGPPGGHSIDVVIKHLPAKYRESGVGVGVDITRTVYVISSDEEDTTESQVIKTEIFTEKPIKETALPKQTKRGNKGKATQSSNLQICRNSVPVGDYPIGTVVMAKVQAILPEKDIWFEAKVLKFLHEVNMYTVRYIADNFEENVSAKFVSPFVPDGSPLSCYEIDDEALGWRHQVADGPNKGWWYSARILEIMPKGARVRWIDFSFKESVLPFTSLLPLPKNAQWWRTWEEPVKSESVCTTITRTTTTTTSTRTTKTTPIKQEDLEDELFEHGLFEDELSSEYIQDELPNTEDELPNTEGEIIKIEGIPEGNDPNPKEVWVNWFRPPANYLAVLPTVESNSESTRVTEFKYIGLLSVYMRVEINAKSREGLNRKTLKVQEPVDVEISYKTKKNENDEDQKLPSGLKVYFRNYKIGRIQVVYSSFLLPLMLRGFLRISAAVGSCTGHLEHGVYFPLKLKICIKEMRTNADQTFLKDVEVKSVRNLILHMDNEDKFENKLKENTEEVMEETYFEEPQESVDHEMEERYTRVVRQFVAANTAKDQTVVVDDNDNDDDDELNNNLALAILTERDLDNLLLSTESTKLLFTKPPKYFNVTLLPYQEQALSWMLQREQVIEHYTEVHPLFEHRQYKHERTSAFFYNWFNGCITFNMPPSPHSLLGGILADEMGMGKTIETVALIMKDRGLKKDTHSFSMDIPIVGTSAKSCIGMYQNKFYGSTKAIHPRELAQNDVVLTTYETLANEYKYQIEGKYKQEGEGKVLKVKLSPLLAVKWLRVVLDEAHMIRDDTTWKSKGADALVSERRWCISGTPLQNKLDDLFCLFKFLHVALFSTPYWWKNIIQEPFMEKNGIALARMNDILKPLMLRRKKNQQLNGKVMLDIPSLTVDKIEIILSDEEQDLYDSLFSASSTKFNKFVNEGVPIRQFMKMSAVLTRLKQVVNHPHLLINAIYASQKRNLNDFMAPTDEDGIKKSKRKGRQENECEKCGKSSMNRPVRLPCDHFYCFSCCTAELAISLK